MCLSSTTSSAKAGFGVGWWSAGEYISELGRNAAQEVRDVMSDQLPSLTLGDAGAAAVLERAPNGDGGIDVAGLPRCRSTAVCVWRSLRS